MHPETLPYLQAFHQAHKIALKAHRATSKATSLIDHQLMHIHGVDIADTGIATMVARGCKKRFAQITSALSDTY